MKIAFVFRTTPHQSSKAQEALEALLIASSLDHTIHLFFLDDGVFQLKQHQETALLETKNFTKAYKALSLYEIKNIYIDESALISRGLNVKDLMISTTLLDEKTIANLLPQHDLIMSF